MRKIGAISGKVKKVSSTQVDPNRYSFLSLENAEPDLGVPSSGIGISISDTNGTRNWASLDSGLTINGSNAISVDEDTLLIDTSTLTNASSNTLSQVLQDFDLAITNAAGISEIITDASLDGDGSANTPLKLSDTGVAVGPYGEESKVPVLTVDAQGRITNAFEVPISLPVYEVSAANTDTILVESFDADLYRGVKYYFQIESEQGFHAGEAIFMHSDFSTGQNIYGELILGQPAGTFSSDLSANSEFLVFFTPAHLNTTLRFTRNIMPRTSTQGLVLPADLNTGPSIIIDLQNDSYADLDLNA